MDRINAILVHKRYTQFLREIEDLERGRPFCTHGLQHALDTARIAYVLCLERRSGIDREIIYGAGLLHDIGRQQQYTNGTPHEQAGARISRMILKECGFNPGETEQITDAILQHREKECAGDNTLGGLLYQADKMSRSCFACKARTACDWPEGRKNMGLKY